MVDIHYCVFPFKSFLMKVVVMFEQCFVGLKLLYESDINQINKLLPFGLNERYISSISSGKLPKEIVV